MSVTNTTHTVCKTAEGSRVKPCPRQRACKYRCKVIRCKGAGQKTAECDAYLNGGQKPRGRFDHVQHESGAFIAILSLFTDFVFIEGYHRRFGGGEERIDQDQQKLKQKLTAYGVVQENTSLRNCGTPHNTAL